MYRNGQKFISESLQQDTLETLERTLEIMQRILKTPAQTGQPVGGNCPALGGIFPLR